MAAKISRFQTYYFSFEFYVVKMTLSLLSLSQNEHEIYKRTQYQFKRQFIAPKDEWQDDMLILDNYKAIHREYLCIFYEAEDEATRLEGNQKAGDLSQLGIE
jgi:hypothetical protein